MKPNLQIATKKKQNKVNMSKTNLMFQKINRTIEFFFLCKVINH